MNKISKKILAIVTMVAFVVTMMPFAAFAAPVEPDNSYIYLSDEENAYVEVGEQVDYTLELRDTAHADADTTANLYIWAEDEDGVVRSVEFYDKANGAGKVVTGSELIKVLDSGYALKPGQSTANREMAIAFTKAGVYTIHAGYALGNTDDITSRSQLVEINDVEGQNTIEVYAEEATVNDIDVTSVTGTGIPEDEFKAYDDEKNTATVKMGDFLANGTAKATVKGHVDTTGSIADQTVAISTNKSSTLKLSTAEAKVDRNGNFEFTVQVTKKTDYKIYLEMGDKEFTLNLDYEQEGAKVDDITTSVNNDAILEAENADVDFSNAVQFAITDENGAEMSGPLGEPAEYVEAGDKPNVDYVDIVKKADKSRLEASDIALYYNTDKDVWTLKYVGDSPERDLVAGEYTVSISVSSGESTEATFTLAEAGDPVGIEFELTAGGSVLEDTVVNGASVTGTVYYVDANGIKTPLEKYNSSVKGDAVPGDVNGLTFTVNAGAEEEYLGSTITVTVLEPTHGFMVTKELTVIDGKTTNTLAFDSENGAANENNTVKVTVVDEDGNLVKNVTGDMYAYISDQSNEDANVEIDVTNDEMKNGKGTLTIFSDKETTVDVVVAVADKDATDTDNYAIYAATLEYTIGEEAVDADTTVAMTIGSSDIIVNNDIVSGDAAPYVDSNWRTMVPLRALTEAFGGTAEWDGDARTVTVVNGDTTIVFDADSNKYTVNDTEKEMDTNLVINDGRTYVPVRFVAEELGYQITVLKDAQGLTAGVVFQK